MINLTRKGIPKLSEIRAENIDAIKKIPEHILTTLVQAGDKTIAKVGMNESSAVRILENRINTHFTDGLNGCNGVLCVAKGLDGNPISILSHYTPLETSRTLNIKAFEKQLSTYDHYIDKAIKQNVFFNITGKEVNGQLVANENPIIAQLKSVFDKFFKQGYDEKIIAYESKSKTPFDSNAMIAQYEKNQAGWQMKLTTAGEKEHHIKLWG